MKEGEGEMDIETGEREKEETKSRRENRKVSRIST